MAVYDKEEDQILQKFVQQPGYRSVHILDVLKGKILRSIGGEVNEIDMKNFLPLITAFYSEIKSGFMEIPLELEMSFPMVDLYAKSIENHSGLLLIIVLMWHNTISYRHDTEILLTQLQKHNFLG